MKKKIKIINMKEKWIIVIGKVEFLEVKKNKKNKEINNYINAEILNYLILNQILRIFGLAKPLMKYVEKNEKK